MSRFRSDVARRDSCPESVECFLVRVVAANLRDPDLLDAHQLPAGYVQTPSFAFGGRVLHGDDVVISYSHVEEASAERATGKRSELCEELVAMAAQPL